MPATPISHPPSSILAVVVVYNSEFSQSHSVSSLFQILSENPELAKHFSVVLYDNSPQPQSPVSPPDFPTHYVHDPSNGGLATAYNFALARAEPEEREWLLLLDLCPESVRPLLVDGKVKEWTSGESHAITDRSFVVRRVLRLNDSLPSDKTEHWIWQRGHWLMVDRVKGSITALHLPDYDPAVSSVI